jgi:mannose-6-phosphate isomerase-like protein (cupin superfamily)
MILRNSEMKRDVKESMRGGTGNTELLTIFPGDKLPGGRLFSEIKLVEGASIGSHTHSGETEYYYILEGEGIVLEDSGEKQVAPGDLVVTGNGESHSIRNIGSSPLRFIAIILFDEK